MGPFFGPFKAQLQNGSRRSRKPRIWMRENDRTGKSMNIMQRYSGLNGRAAWRSLVEAQLQKLESYAAVAAARIAVERLNHVKPAFKVSAVLEVPGPDFHAEASDHTFAAAVSKVVKNLERQIRARQGHRAAKRKTNVQLGLLPGRSTPGLTASRA